MLNRIRVLTSFRETERAPNAGAVMKSRTERILGCGGALPPRQIPPQSPRSRLVGQARAPIAGLFATVDLASRPVRRPAITFIIPYRRMRFQRNWPSNYLLLRPEFSCGPLNFLISPPIPHISPDNPSVRKGPETPGSSGPGNTDCPH